MILDVDFLICEVNKRKREKKNVILVDVFVVDYWGILGNLIDCEGIIIKLSECIIFCNVVCMCLVNFFILSEIEVEELVGFV